MAKKKKTRKVKEVGSVEGKERQVKPQVKPAEGEAAPKDEAVTPPVDKEKERVEGIKKTVIPGIIGTIAGIILFAVINDGSEYSNLWFSILFILLALAFYAQRLIFPGFGINVRSFGKKDWFYVEFIVLDFCLVSWTILLNINS